VATAWLRQRDRKVIAILGIRTLDQLHDVLGCLEVELSAEHRARLDQVSRIELGFPYELLRGPQGQMVYGDLEPQIDLPPPHPSVGPDGSALERLGGVVPASPLLSEPIGVNVPPAASR
jgi:hypothetical protein